MPYDETLASRIRESLAPQPIVEEKKMLGGLTFMVNDKMCVGIQKNALMARIDPDLHAEALQKNGCREMDFTGRPLKGFVLIGPEAITTKSELDYWISLALSYNSKAKSSRRKKQI